MTCAMRIYVFLMLASFGGSSARAEMLSAPDREALLENLDKLHEAATSKVDARFRLAIAAYRTGLSSDDAALDLYLRCIEKVDFEDQQKSKSEFTAWRHQDDIKQKLTDPSFKVALRYQLSWLILSLQAASEKANIPALTIEAQEIVDSIFRDAVKLAGVEKELSQSVTSTVFAKVYEISNLGKAKWPMAPGQLEEFYNVLVFPPLRNPARISTLRAAWTKRIQQEGIKIEAGWGGGNANHKPKSKDKDKDKGKPNKGAKPDFKIGMAPEFKNPEYERFVIETLPDLKWQMEIDLFRSGDESTAAMRMLALIEKYPTHKSAGKWLEEFRKLLKTAGPVTPGAEPAAPPSE